MEEGCNKCKRLSFSAKFKCEVIRCTEEKGNRKAAAVLEFMKATLLYCIVLTAHTAALSCFQNPAVDCESNLHAKLIYI
jgi:hypothetical protein